jgi:hypothetical protein
VKGLVISLLALLAFLFSAVLAARVFRPKRHLHLFVPTAAFCSVVYLVLYLSVPASVGFLPPAWQCSNPWLDGGYGFLVYWLNIHTVVDVFFATCGGFSVSLLSVILRNQEGIRAEDLVEAFSGKDGGDKIYNWRVPHLERQGYLTRIAGTGHYQLTAKGRLVALLTDTLKRLMNLGKGG